MGLFSRLCSSESRETAVPQEPQDNPNQDGNRVQWSSPAEFTLTCIGYSVGLGNVWRFPYLCYKSGGGAFLIPYMIMICFIGMPLLFMEYGFGQYFGVGSLSIYNKVCPLFQGIGIGYVVVNALVCIYYNVIIALSLYYLFASFTTDLPWANCGHPWNTPACGDPHEALDTSGNFSYGNYSEVSNFTLPGNMSLHSNVTHLTRKSPSDEYFRLHVLNMDDSHSIENIGHIQWKLCLCLLLAWVLVVAFVSKGIQSTGKVAYFTATFPYVMLTVLVARGVTLPGASTGILYFVKPQFKRLLEPEVWFGAATQLFYSTNLAWGGMITMASYNEFNHNCRRDAIMINMVSFCTSIYAGFAVFSIIGYMANEYGLDVEKIIDSGPGLAFIVYPRALSLMPLAPLWSVLFFFMLFLLGIGSQMVIVETVLSGLVDEFPKLGLNACMRIMTACGVCSVFFLIGLPMTTQGGMYVLQLMDWYSAGFSVLVIAIFECLSINWFYGDDKMAMHVKEMLGTTPHIYWRICWKYISGLVIVLILIFSMVKYAPASYGNYYYPAWADGLGWIMSLASILPIFVVAGYKFAKAEGSTLREKFHFATEPKVEIQAKPKTQYDDIELGDVDIKNPGAEEMKLMTTPEKG